MATKNLNMLALRDRRKYFKQSHGLTPQIALEACEVNKNLAFVSLTY